MHISGGDSISKRFRLAIGAAFLTGAGTAIPCHAQAVDAGESGTISVRPEGEASVAPTSVASAEVTQIDEVIVTASKRSESEFKVPAAISAISERQLEAIGAEDFGDYLSTVPGVQFNKASADASVVSIRGVTTTNRVTDVQSPVGIFFDEIPLTDPFNSILIPDIDAFDAAQIEVLKGPQGALYGSGALGGAINYSPNRADASNFDARMETSGVLQKNGKLGGGAKGMVNLPIVDETLAVRAVGFTRYTPGYIDNVGTGREDSNASRVYGGRLMTTWNLSDSTTLSLANLYQHSHTDDASYVTEGLGDLQKTSGVPEVSTGELSINSLRLESDLGFANLIGIAGYQYKRYDKDDDITPQFSNAFGPVLTNALLAPTVSARESQLNGYTAELRLVSPSGERFEWLAGAFYGDRRESIDVFYNALGLDKVSNPITTLAQILLGNAGTAIGSMFDQTHTLFTADIDTQVIETAVYAEASYRLAEHWKVSAGGRGFNNRVRGGYVASGIYEFATTGQATQTVTTRESESGFNPKVSLAYTPDDSTLLYATYSRGYALGGPNLAAATSRYDLPNSYGSSTLDNYELGFKTAMLDRRLILGLTPFYMEWSDVPLPLTSPDALVYFDNAGAARMYGAETSLTALPINDLVLTTGLTYLRSQLSEDYDPGNGQDVVPSGTTLPGAAKWQASFIATYKWQTWGLPTQLSLIDRYIGSSPSVVQSGDIRQGGYNTLSLRGMLQWGAIGFELFADNLTDKRGVASKYVNANYDVRDYIEQPRTIGMTLSWSWQ